MRYHDNEAVEMTTDDLDFLEKEAGEGESIGCPTCGSTVMVGAFVGDSIASFICENNHYFEG